jgi:integrase
MKWKPDPLGGWVKVTLGKDPRLAGARPPKTPPQHVLDRAREFEEAEYRARHGMGAAPKRVRGLEDYLRGYVAAYSGRRRGSVKQLNRHVESFIAFCESRGVRSFQGVDRALCRDYLEGRSKVASAATLKTEKGYLSGIWTRAEDDGLIGRNPWRRLPLPGKPGETSITFWSADEIARIAAACLKPWHRDLVLILANTGLRISTALSMTWEWVDWREGLVRIRAGEDVKTAYVHKLNETARAILERRRATVAGDFVFPGRGGGRAHYDTGRGAIERAIAKAGVRPGTTHDLRHSYARLLVLAGVPITVVQSQLGHTTLAMTQRYSSTNESHAAGFVGRVEIGGD